MTSALPRENVVANEKCANCGAALVGEYCSSCGEKRISEQDFRLHHFAIQALNGITNVDSKLLRSLRYVIAQPGLLTREYFSGRRARYLRPLDLFLLVNLLFFLASPFTRMNTFATTLQLHKTAFPWSPLARRMVGAELAHRHIDSAAYTARFNDVTTDHAKSLVIICIPLFACFLALLLFRNRHYFVEHVVFSIHYFTFVMITVLAVGALVRLSVAVLPPRALHTLFFTDMFITLVLFAAVSAYLYLAVRRVYGLRAGQTAWRSLLAGAATFVVIQLYRFILFFTVFYTI